MSVTVEEFASKFKPGTLVECLPHDPGWPDGGPATESRAFLVLFVPEGTKEYILDSCAATKTSHIVARNDIWVPVGTTVLQPSGKIHICKDSPSSEIDLECIVSVTPL